MSGLIREIQAEDYEKEVLGAPLAVLDFYSSECPPCEAFAAKYEPLSEIYGKDVRFFKIFRQQNRDLALKLEVSASPTVLFYRNGKPEGDRLTGGIKRSAVVRNLDNLVGEERAAVLKAGIKRVNTECDVLILGGGPAGLTAGIYCAQARLNTLLADISLTGGYVTTTHQVSNYPGYVEPQPGYMLAHVMSEQAKAAGVAFRAAVEISKLDLPAGKVEIDELETVTAKKIIIATGSSPKPLGLPGEEEYRGNGLSYCSTCDAKYFDGKDVIIIGGGNSAIEESLFIAKFAKTLTVVHQFAELQANKQAQEKVFAEKKISFLFEHEPREFIRHGVMDMEVKAEDLKTGKMKSLRTNGVFIFVGFIPNLELLGSVELERDNWGYIVTDEDMKTTIPNVFAIGDVRSKRYRQITTAVADGTIAAIAISRELG
ncbi:MAG: thioredoxin-disulfide reductase [Spirochaetales bacterium]|nr:MAG: thioredoxin-disulfide reductase [Spirochaetales bacterium]